MNPTSLQNKAKQYMKLWHLEPGGEPFNTHFCFLWPCLKGSEELMLKLLSEECVDDLGAYALKLFDGHGCIKIFENENAVQLLERVITPKNQPSLRQMLLAGNEDTVTNIICDVAARLHDYAETIDKKGYPAFENKFINDINDTATNMRKGGIRPPDMPMFERGLALSRELEQAMHSDRLFLHGDLHHDNILYSADRGWVAIDPKGIIAPRAYDYAISLVHMPDLPEETIMNPRRIERMSKIISDKSGIDQKTILQFAWIKALQLGAWASGEPYKTQCIELAKIIDKFIT
ncbi:MAG: phosphotransferase [Alphaproteobacteria bacterium]|nr:phosphotransferase [Alphaproteobacteria bacterium]